MSLLERLRKFSGVDKQGPGSQHIVGKYGNESAQEALNRYKRSNNIILPNDEIIFVNVKPIIKRLDR